MTSPAHGVVRIPVDTDLTMTVGWRGGPYAVTSDGYARRAASPYSLNTQSQTEAASNIKGRIFGSKRDGAQAVRRPAFGPRSGHVGFVVDKVVLGQVFAEYFGFPCQFSFHRLLHTHHLPSGAGTIGQTVAAVVSGLSLTPPQER
jgi:hypothetical protein